MNQATSEPSAETEGARISRALELLREEIHPLENVLQAFEPALIEKARFRTGLPTLADEHIPTPDPARFENGVPLASAEMLIDFPQELWEQAFVRLIPALEQGFPSLKQDLHTIGLALANGELDPQYYLRAAAEGRGEAAQEVAAKTGVNPRSLGFVLGQVMKPLVEKRAEALQSRITGLRWQKGYCPICGSMPELAYLKGDEGQRWLRCSFCGSDWRYVRLACPFCENEEQGSLIIYYIAGREQERVEACEKCGRYVVSIDLRGRFDDAVLEVAAIGMVHLDVLSQQKGLLPAAVCAWNIVTGEDIVSSSVEIHAKKWAT
jgi:FdhE protein